MEIVLLLNSFQHDDLNVVVIGASGGIGQEFVSQIQSSDRVKKLHAFSRDTLDFANEASVISAAEKSAKDGPIDIVIVATGLLHRGRNLQPEKNLGAIDPDNFNEIYLSNTIGPALVMKHFLPKLSKDRKAIFAVLSARVGSISDNQLGGWYAYRSSKAALNMLLKTASIEISRTHKQACVVGLHPGTVETNLSEPFRSNSNHYNIFSSNQSVSYLLNVIDGLGPESTGKVFDWDGKEIAP